MRRRHLTEDTASDLLSSPAADDFAKALDLCGWMIVCKPEFFDSWRPPRWPMNKPSRDCPAWADNGLPKPTLHVIDNDDEPRPA